MRLASSSDHVYGRPQFLLKAIDQSVNQVYKSVIKAGLHGVTVFLPISAEGSRKSINGRRAVRENKAEIEIAMPGQMIPPRYSALALIVSNVIAVPRSTTMQALRNRTRRQHCHDTIGAYLGSDYRTS